MNVWGSDTFTQIASDLVSSFAPSHCDVLAIPESRAWCRILYPASLKHEAAGPRFNGAVSAAIIAAGPLTLLYFEELGAF